jgi:hypothetical protein
MTTILMSVLTENFPHSSVAFLERPELFVKLSQCSFSFPAFVLRVAYFAFTGKLTSHRYIYMHVVFRRTIGIVLK